MIPDKLFKELQHLCKGYKPFARGGILEQGYKPDYVLKKQNDYIILESENSSSRKTFVGGLIKAAHFLSGDKTGTLIFVIVPKPNTTDSAIARHLQKYLLWVSDKTNLRDVYVVESNSYYKDEALLTLLSKSFISIAKKV
jgi:hypothetical protein